MPPSTQVTDSDGTQRETYHLPRDAAETIRLNAQHHALVHRTGWLLHPKIEESISKITRPQVADVACGTGIWALEVAEKFPATLITGLDVSTKQFPPQWSWPDNGKLEMLDLLGEIPPQYRGKFDVVHCRFLLAAGPMVDPKLWADAFSKLLKPGGWLQWQEMTYPTSTRFEPVRVGPATVKTYTEIPILTEGIAEVGNLAYKCAPVPRFGEWMKENTTFQHIEHLDMVPSPQHARYETHVICAGVFSGATSRLQTPGLGDATRERLREDQAMPDRIAAAGALCAYRLGLCIARSPRSHEVDSHVNC